MNYNLLIPFDSEILNSGKTQTLEIIKRKHFFLQNYCELHTFNLYIEEPNKKFIIFENKLYYYIPNALNFTVETFNNISNPTCYTASNMSIIAREYLKICSFAFLLGIGKNCFLNLENDKLIMTDVKNQTVDNIMKNILDIFSPKDILYVFNDVCAKLENWQKYNFISQNDKLYMINTFENQLLIDMNIK